MVTINGELKVDEKPFDGTLNGTIHLNLRRTLSEEPTKTNLLINSASEPIVLPSEDWRFFRLLLE